MKGHDEPRKVTRMKTNKIEETEEEPPPLIHSITQCLTIIMWGLKNNSWMLKKLRRETQIQTDFPTSHCLILKAHITE